MRCIPICTILVIVLVSSSVTAQESTNGQGEGGEEMDAQTNDELLESLVIGQTAFALDLLQQLRDEPGNLFFSPYSISTALAMVFAGARGDTQAEMARVLHWEHGAQALLSSVSVLTQRFSPDTSDEAEQTAGQLELAVANSMWLDAGYHFLPEYLGLLAAELETGAQNLDFQNHPEDARQTINDWVSQATEARIADLLGPGSIDELTRLVLANAVYFRANWQNEFDPANTTAQAFHRLDGNEVTVPTMHRTDYIWAFEGPDYVAVDLLYVGGDTSMLVVVPNSGTFEGFEQRLDAGLLSTISGGMTSRYVDLSFPGFEVEQRINLGEVLSSMGIETAFSENADFSGMDGTRELYISSVFHKAFVTVDERGTEATAATTAVMGWQSIPPPPLEVHVDRPFLFVIRHRGTGAILFMGRVVDPD